METALASDLVQKQIQARLKEERLKLEARVMEQLRHEEEEALRLARAKRVRETPPPCVGRLETRAKVMVRVVGH